MFYKSNFREVQKKFSSEYGTILFSGVSTALWKVRIVAYKRQKGNMFYKDNLRNAQKKVFLKNMLGICKGRTRFTLHCAHIHIFQLALRKEFLQRKIGKCEFCNRARRNLVIYEIVSLREQNHHLKYTKQSLKMVLIEEYLLQKCNRCQNKFAPTHRDCERWAFIPKNASEQNILYSPALKIIFRDPGEIF